MKTPHPDPPPQGGRESTPGRYGRYGGQYIPETLMAAVEELEVAFDAGGQVARRQPLERRRRGVERRQHRVEGGVDALDEFVEGAAVV